MKRGTSNSVFWQNLQYLLPKETVFGMNTHLPVRQAGKEAVITKRTDLLSHDPYTTIERWLISLPTSGTNFR